MDELQNVGKNGGTYQVSHAFSYVLLLIPSHLYELLPITVLIGTIFVMARLAQSSEFTILRTSGLGPTLALRNLLGLGLAFVLLTFAIGDYLSPFCDRYGQLLKSRYLGQITVGQTGAWLRERQDDRSFAVNVTTITPEGNPAGIRIFEFNKEGQWVSLTKAKVGLIANDEAWELRSVERDEQKNAPGGSTLVRHYTDRQLWTTSITSEMISVALLKPERMGTIDLFHYIRHLSANGQATQRFEIEFWKKVFYPLSCLVMVVLALPFAMCLAACWLASVSSYSTTCSATWATSTAGPRGLRLQPLDCSTPSPHSPPLAGWCCANKVGHARHHFICPWVT